MTDKQIMMYCDWGNDEQEDAISWITRNHPETTVKELMAYKAGFSSAWTKAMAILNLHGLIK